MAFSITLSAASVVVVFLGVAFQLKEPFDLMDDMRRVGVCWHNLYRYLNWSFVKTETKSFLFFLCDPSVLVLLTDILKVPSDKKKKFLHNTCA